ncbi:hypothetical protein QTP88_018287 [Uroleucon formosanum]
MSSNYLLFFLSMFMPPAYLYAFKNTSAKIPDHDILNPRKRKILMTSKESLMRCCSDLLILLLLSMSLCIIFNSDILSFKCLSKCYRYLLSLSTCLSLILVDYYLFSCDTVWTSKSNKGKDKLAFNG